MTTNFRRPVLYGRVFGTGNAVMSVPAVKAIASVHGPVDILIGGRPEDGGSWSVFNELRRNYPWVVGDIFIECVPLDRPYAVAVIAIPFDGRWRNGVNFMADEVIDCRPRPPLADGSEAPLGFSSWLKHECLYQMEDARVLGWVGDDWQRPSARFLPEPVDFGDGTVYLGIGYKRSNDAIWLRKSWGPQNFNLFCRALPQTGFVATGNATDLQQVARYIDAPNFRFKMVKWEESFEQMSDCSAYFGNDTGMMHVAASLGRPTFGLYAFDNLDVKNHPLDCDYRFLRMPVEPEDAARQFREFIGAE